MVRVTIDLAPLVVELVETVPQTAYVVKVVARDPCNAMLALRTSIERER